MTTIETSARLLRRFDEFTADWVSKALSQRFPGAIVSGFSRNGERVGTSASCRFELTYANRGEGDDAPNVVYFKGGFTEQQLGRYWMVLQQEARFYNALSHDVPMIIPRHYFAAIDEEKQGITMLEDLVSRNLRSGFWGELTVDDVAELLEQFAALHARGLGDARRFMAYSQRAEHRRPPRRGGPFAQDLCGGGGRARHGDAGFRCYLALASSANGARFRLGGLRARGIWAGGSDQRRRPSGHHGRQRS